MAPYTPSVVFITGASSGFGAACARAFAALGTRLVLLGRRKDHLDRLAKSLGVPAHVVTADVRVREAVEKVVTDLPPQFAEVDVLLNNAGLALGLEPAHEASVDDWETMVDTNCKGLMYCTRVLLPGMVARGRGHIINMGSTAGDYPYPGGNVYGATKAFVKQFSLNLRADLVRTGVRVTNIEPGMAETEFSLVRFHGDAAKAQKVYDGMRPLSADDVADTVAWCATRPLHVNIDRVELMPSAQAAGPLAVHRKS